MILGASHGGLQSEAICWGAWATYSLPYATTHREGLITSGAAQSPTFAGFNKVLSGTGGTYWNLTVLYRWYRLDGTGIGQFQLNYCQSAACICFGRPCVSGPGWIYLEP